jgi:hypothetical protein
MLLAYSCLVLNFRNVTLIITQIKLLSLIPSLKLRCLAPILNINLSKNQKHNKKSLYLRQIYARFLNQNVNSKKIFAHTAYSMFNFFSSVKVWRVNKTYDHFREEIAATVLTTFKVACDPWGVTVERVEVGTDEAKDNQKIFPCLYVSKLELCQNTGLRSICLI